jgi:hypothetical protein
VIDAVGISNPETLLSGHTGAMTERWGGLGSLPLQCSPLHVVSRSHLESCKVHGGSKCGVMGGPIVVVGVVTSGAWEVEVGSEVGVAVSPFLGTSRPQTVFMLTVSRLNLQAVASSELLHGSASIVVVQLSSTREEGWLASPEGSISEDSVLSSLPVVCELVEPDVASSGSSSWSSESSSSSSPLSSSPGSGRGSSVTGYCIHPRRGRPASLKVAMASYGCP